MSDILGIDEVGVGALAGPAFVGLVDLGENIVKGIRDSKRLSPNTRRRLALEIKAVAAICEVEIVPLSDIEEFNIRGAVNRSIGRALRRLPYVPANIYMDGIVDPNVGRKVICIKGGDDLIPAISAASIVAKVARDAYMAELSREFPVYGWSDNCGYPTKQHREALDRYGASKWHRMKYAPVMAVLSKYKMPV